MKGSVSRSMNFGLKTPTSTETHTVPKIKETVTESRYCSYVRTRARTVTKSKIKENEKRRKEDFRNKDEKKREGNDCMYDKSINTVLTFFNKSVCQRVDCVSKKKQYKRNSIKYE